jgi:Domain of unknown function (DUF4262)
MDIPGRLIHQFDQYDAWQRETIRSYGWAIQFVLADEESPPFAYTVGLSGWGAHPELILFATSQATAAAVLNELGELVRAGRRLSAGETLRIPSGHVQLLEFPESGRWLLAANSLYRSKGGPPVPALLVMPSDDLAESPGEDEECIFCR